MKHNHRRRDSQGNKRKHGSGNMPGLPVCHLPGFTANLTPSTGDPRSQSSDLRMHPPNDPALPSPPAPSPDGVPWTRPPPRVDLLRTLVSARPAFIPASVRGTVSAFFSRHFLTTLPSLITQPFLSSPSGRRPLYARGPYCRSTTLPDWECNSSSQACRPAVGERRCY